MASPWYIDPLHITLRLLLAVVLGGLVGWEREHSRHAAGFRTHILVSLGSTLVMLLSMYGFSAFANEPHVSLDPARLAAQVVSGIGFLGAGAILHRGLSIQGLTTAASLWVVAAIGLAVGAGFYYASVLSAVFVLLSLRILNQVELHFFGGKRSYSLKIHGEGNSELLAGVSAILEKWGADIRKVTIEKISDPEKQNHTLITFAVRPAKKKDIIPIIEEMKREHPVFEIEVEIL